MKLLILVRMVSKIKDFLDLYEHSLTAVYTANLCSKAISVGSIPQGTI